MRVIHTIAGRDRASLSVTTVAILVLLASSCAGSVSQGSPPGGADPPTTGPTIPTTAPPPTSPPVETARFRFFQQQKSCCYIEGQTSYVVVRDATGKVVLRRSFFEFDTPGAVVDRQLPPGRYEVVSYQRPCDGNCGYLDPPVDRCTRRITLTAGDDISLTSEWAPGEGCSLVKAEMHI